jgi:hypothetical protein
LLLLLAGLLPALLLATLLLLAGLLPTLLLLVRFLILVLVLAHAFLFKLDSNLVSVIPDPGLGQCAGHAFVPFDASSTLTRMRWNSDGLPCIGGANLQHWEAAMGRYLLLWLLGIPLPILLLIWLFAGLH